MTSYTKGAFSACLVSSTYPMVTILNDNIVLAVFLQDVIARTQKIYYMLMYVFGIYDSFFNLEGGILG